MGISPILSWKSWMIVTCMLQLQEEKEENVPARDLPRNRGVILTPKHQSFGKMTPSFVFVRFLFNASVHGNNSKVPLIQNKRYIK